jgi:hypothetical protein
VRRCDSPFDTTGLHLEVLDYNVFVEIDTRNGYEYHKVYGYTLKNDGTLNAILSDVSNNESSFQYKVVAKATDLRRGKEKGVVKP